MHGNYGNYVFNFFSASKPVPNLFIFVSVLFGKHFGGLAQDGYWEWISELITNLNVKKIVQSFFFLKKFATKSLDSLSVNVPHRFMSLNPLSPAGGAV